MIKIENISYGYKSNHPIFNDISLEIGNGIYGLLGENGVGKTTLIHLLCGLLFPWKGECSIDGMNPAKREPALLSRYFFLPEEMQMPSESISAFATRHSAFYPHFNHKEFEQNLEELKIDRKQKLSAVSYGQQKKAMLAYAFALHTPLLILDEPTNHLDMRSKDVLKEAIREFDGTVIIVSHDRDFLDGLATKVYEFGGGVVKEHLGGIYDFLQKKKIENLNELQKNNPLSASPTSGKKEEGAEEGLSENKLSYEAQKEFNKKIKKLERQVADCEAAIEQTESAIAILEEKMATPDGASDMSLYEQHQKLKQQLDHTVEEWERVSMELEEMNEK